MVATDNSRHFRIVQVLSFILNSIVIVLLEFPDNGLDGSVSFTSEGRMENLIPLVGARSSRRSALPNRNFRE